MVEENVDDPLPLPDMTPKKRRLPDPRSPEQRKKQHSEQQPEEDPEVGITVKYDFGWDKRGNGFRYDSRSGRGSLFGQLTNACLGYMVMSSYCRKCAMGASPDDHDCVRNHDGSAKAMEPRAAVQLCLNNLNLTQANVRVDTIVADRDASTFAALTRESPHPINRLVDLNHNLKGFNNDLFPLKKSFTWLTTDCIEYLKRCFQKAIKQNKNDVMGVRKAILNIVPHVYNEHDGCGDWCKAKTQLDHPFKNLPQMKPLSDPAFRVRLEEIIGAQAAQAEQLAACGSTQVNENFNHMVVSRSAKSRFYGGTNALKTRVAGAVCVKNIGIDYTDNVFQAAHLSPTVTKGRSSLKKAIERARLYKKLPEVKRRRLQLKCEERWHEAKENNTGGITYASGMGNVMDRAVAATTAAMSSTQQISSWIPPPSVLQPNCALVFLDLETTGFGRDCEILQVAATCQGAEYSAYMQPQGKISQQASEATGLRMVRGRLVHNSVAVPTKPHRIVASELLAFLKYCGEQVVLVGHNLVRFDAPRLLQFMKNYGEPMEFCEVVHGLVDTVPHLKQGRVGRLEQLAHIYLTDSKWSVIKRNAHNALSDCALVEGLLDHFSISREALLSSRVTMEDFMRRQVFLRNQTRLSKDLMCFTAAGISKHMIYKMAGAGVTMGELKEVMVSKGTKGIGPCLGVQINGKPRVTCNKKIVERIATFVRQTVEADGVDLSHLT